MLQNVNSAWILSVFFFKILKTVNLQFEMPMYAPAILPQPGPMFPPPLLPIAIPVSSEEKTTTTEEPKKKKFQMVFPPFPKINFRDVKRQEKGIIVPPIMAPAPPSFVLVPPAIPRPIFPRRRPRKKLEPVFSSESTDSSSSSECYTAKRTRKRRRPNINRRRLRSSENNDQLLKPMLSYVSDNGDVKFETRISNDDVAQLLGKDKKVANDRIQSVQVYTKEDESNNQQMIVVSKGKGSSGRTFRRYKQVLLRDGLSNHVLSEGKKELIFRPPADQKISNISLSFNIS